MNHFVTTGHSDTKFSGTKMPDLDSCIPLPLDEKALADVVDKAKDWAIMHGAAMRSKNEFNPDGLQVR